MSTVVRFSCGLELTQLTKSQHFKKKKKKKNPPLHLTTPKSPLGSVTVKQALLDFVDVFLAIILFQIVFRFMKVVVGQSTAF